MPGVLELVAADMLDRIHKNPEKFREKHQKAEEKFVFLGEEKNKKSEIRY